MQTTKNPAGEFARPTRSSNVNPTTAGDAGITRRPVGTVLVDLARAAADLYRLQETGTLDPQTARAIGAQWDAVDDAMRALIWDAGQAGATVTGEGGMAA